MALEESNKRKSCDEVEIIDENDGLQDSNEPDTKKLKNEDQPNLKTSEENGETINLIEDNPSESIKINIESDGEIIELDNETPSKDIPFCINIKFKDDAIAELYKAKFIKFINSFIELDAISEDNLSINVVKDESAKPQEWIVLDEDNIAIENDVITDTPSKKRKNKRSKAKKELFVVDATPSEEAARFDVKYKTKFKINIEKGEDKNNEARPQQAKCFNCDQPHQLRDCPNPKNYEKINAARQKMKQHPKVSRYHLECAQKFGDIKPGKISPGLRKALGLGREEIPRHVYLMRKFGYPPGWLKEAKMIYSNIDLFDLNGKNVKTDHEKKKGLDPKHIIDYSGFNAPMDEGSRDDYRRHGVPPYSKEITKEIIMSTYKESTDDEDDYSTDMEIDNDDEDIEEPQEIKPSKDEEEIPRISPSLVDLEEQKNSLLNELNDKSESNEKTENDKELPAVKTTSFGTPILKSSSPYMTLPNPDNFSKDVSPVINFENLPNSTGKYEQMTDVLHKVRTTLKKIQNI